MQLQNSYWSFQSALTEDQCDRILELGTTEMSNLVKNGKPIDASTFTGTDKASKEKDRSKENLLVSMANLTIDEVKRKKIDLDKIYDRDVHIAMFSDDEVYSWLWPFCKLANSSAGWNFDWDFSEPMQFGKYSENQFHGWHADFGPSPYGAYWDVRNPPEGEPYDTIEEGGETIYVPKGGFHSKENRMKWNQSYNQAGKIRKLSMTVNLSHPNEYSGGNLKFDFGPHSRVGRYHTCEEIRPRGSIIVFPSNIYHQVTPITKGTRHSLVMWSLGLPFR